MFDEASSPKLLSASAQVPGESSQRIPQFCGRPLTSGVIRSTIVIAVLLLAPRWGMSADYSAAQRLFFSGKYGECMEVAQAEVERGVWNENWPKLLLDCQLTTGKYAEAVKTYEAAIERFSNSIGLRMKGHEVYSFVGQPKKAKEQYDDIVRLVQKSPWRYSSSRDRVTLGRFLLAQGEDARDVLELFYDRARRSNARYADTYVAIAELALQKHDYQEAANSLQTAVELEPDNPQIHYLLAKAWNSDGEKVKQFINNAIELNARHIPSLLFRADNLIDGEKYQESELLLSDVININPHHPLAWAYHAVIAHLRGNSKKEVEHRAKALSKWSTNPEVDHLIGKKLSRNYRFAEGAKYQMRALKIDKSMLAAKFQLSQDLLRTGDEETGWKLARQVHDADAYNVVAYNTVTLQKEIAKFDSLENEHFVLRMDTREAKIYGQQVLQLLEEAHDKFTEKYDTKLQYPTIVEIFPKQKDFAIRTFGLPGGAGYLGVCFGRVVTANSPASQGPVPANWQSVLWHEFCHVVTLTKTNNKMPRWLSEGISTYEEQQRNESWGERISPQYQQMIAGEALTPVSQLSAAFMSPKSPIHLQFAYFESSLVVRFLIEKYGEETLQRILTDLGVGMPINESLQRYVGSLKQLDRDFAKYARDFAKQVAPEVDWTVEEAWAAVGNTPEKLDALLKQHPKNYFLMRQKATLAMRDKQWDAAESTLKELIQLYPDDRDPKGALAMLAALYRQTKQEDKELTIMKRVTQITDRALDAYARLAQWNLEKEQYAEAKAYALQYLSVQPMAPLGHRLLAKSAEALDEPKHVAAALGALLEMEPVDPAETHFRLAKALGQSGDPVSAKRQVLMALEEAPRYRVAQQYLLELREIQAKAAKSTVDSGPGKPEKSYPENKEVDNG